MRILVVDDDLVTGTMLDKVLAKKGYRVTHVTDGARALEALQAQSYRIVLTDWMMPGMDGLTLCRHIRELNPPQYIYVILLTAKSSKSDAVAGLEAGADDYIVKPFDQHELLARIRAGRRLVELEDARKETQLRLTRSEKMAAIGHLAAGIAHEINNPIGFLSSNMNSLKGYLGDVRTMLACYKELVHTLDASVSQQKMAGDLPAMIRKSRQMEGEIDLDFVMQDTDELLNDCTEGVSRVKSIVHEMRYFAHPEKQVFEFCNLPELLKKIGEEFRMILPAGVTLKIPVGILPQIECNVAHMEQAFSNIIKNAIEAVGSQGLITISAACQRDMIHIRITDTGKGIAQENLEMVFNPFFTTKEVGQGVGLGLTTAMNIIKMHNGTISCESHPGRETSFTVKLPLSGFEC